MVADHCGLAVEVWDCGFECRWEHGC